MKKLLLCALFGFSLNSFAQGDVNKIDVNGALDQMQKSGMFSPEQIEAARNQLNGMTAKDFDRIKQKAIEMSNNPEVKAKAAQVIRDGTYHVDQDSLEKYKKIEARQPASRPQLK